jgi:hypothetical protein
MVPEFSDPSTDTYVSGEKYLFGKALLKKASFMNKTAHFS